MAQIAVDAEALQFRGIAHQPLDHRFHIGAMVADEGDERALGPANFQRIDLAVAPGKLKPAPSSRNRRGVEVLPWLLLSREFKIFG